MITFETETGLKIQVGGKNIDESHKRLIKFFKELKKLLKSPVYDLLPELIEEALAKYEIDLEAI